ncbi:MAG: bestrophin family ion channel [Pseudomonadota bacterium]|nr:bestrophin family ion channel [Pseudomonadota bacterium]
MIIRPKQHWLRMLLVWHGSILPRILPQLLLVTLLSVLVTWLHGRVFDLKVPLNFVPFPLIGLALAIFLGFRNSASYERFWEGRKLWGILLNDCRTLARQLLSFTGSIEQSKPIILTLIATVHALRHQLRGSMPQADLQRLLGDDQSHVAEHHFVPNMLLLHAAQQITDLRTQGHLDLWLSTQCEAPLARLTDAIGGCERLHGTLLPYTYSVILHRIVYLYCFLLPFALVDTIGWTTPVIVAFIAYTFFALEAISDELEEPFGRAANDLALNGMSYMIEHSLLEMIGETPNTPSPTPIKFILD